MSKYLSADELLTGIIGGTKDVVIDGLGSVQVRAIEYMEMKLIRQEAEDDEMRAALLLVIRGLEQPKLEGAQLDSLEKARPGVIVALAKAVQELSGLGADIEKKVGTGS